MATTNSQEAAEQGMLAVMLARGSDRLVLEVGALLVEELPRIGGPAFERAVQILRARFPVQIAGAMLNDFVLLLSELGHSARLPRLRSGRHRSSNSDEVFFVAMLAALQRTDKGRAIEAAIAMLDTGRLNGVMAVADTLAQRLAANGVLLSTIDSDLFDAVAGYPVVEAPEAPAPVKPALRLLQSA